MIAWLLWVSFLGLLPSTAWAGWPVTVVPRLEGIVVDSATGAGVVDAVVVLNMTQTDRLGGGHILPRSFNSKTYYAVTNEKGEFGFPFTVWGSVFYRRPSTRVMVYHPLYEGTRGYLEPDKEMKSEVYAREKVIRAYAMGPTEGDQWWDRRTVSELGERFSPSDLVVKMLSLREKARREKEKCEQLVNSNQWKENRPCFPDIRSRSGDYMQLALRAGTDGKRVRELQQQMWSELISMAKEMVPDAWPYKQDRLQELERMADEQLSK